MTKKHILVDDSNLLKSVSEVLVKDSKRQRAQTEAAYQRSKGQKQMTFSESCRYVAETEAQDSLARYPNENPPTGDRKYPVVDSRYHSDDPYMVPKQKVSPQVGNRGDSASIQRELVDAAQKVAAVWSKLIDPRNRAGRNDIEAAKRFLKIAFSSLLDEE